MGGAGGGGGGFGDGFVLGGGRGFGFLASGRGGFGAVGGSCDGLDLDGEAALLLDHHHGAGAVIGLDDALGELAI